MPLKISAGMMRLIGLIQMAMILLKLHCNAQEISMNGLTTTTNIGNIEEAKPTPPSNSAMSILTRVFVPIIFGIICIVGLVGNCLVIAVIIVNGHMRNSTNILISSLAVADLTFIVFCIPLTMGIYISQGWIWGTFMCMIYQYLTPLTVYCSVYTLVLMSIDRFMAVVHPIISVNWRTRNRSVAAVFILWLLVIVVNLPLLLYSGVVHSPYKIVENNQSRIREFCTNTRLVYYNVSLDGYVDDFRAMGYYHFTFFLFGFLIPLSVIVILYGLLLYRISKRLNSQQSANITRSNKKVTRLVVSVIIAFGVSWLPLHIVFLIQSTFGDPKSVSFRSFHMVANSMAYGNSMINPILYAFLSENFRKAFKNVLTCTFSGCYQSNRGANCNASVNNRTDAVTKYDQETKIQLMNIKN